MGAQTEVKFQTKKINVTGGPILVVGQNPGKQRSNEQTFTVWEGNRSADLLLEALDGTQNLFFTNVCNYQVMDEGKILEGLEELREIIEDYEPSKVLCFGDFAYKKVKSLKQNVVVVKMLHPSFIVRFQKDRQEYIQAVRKELQ